MTPIDGLMDEIEVNFNLLQTALPGSRERLHANLLGFGARFHELVADPHAQASWKEFCGYCDTISRTGDDMRQMAAVGCLVFIRHRIAERDYWKPSIVSDAAAGGTLGAPSRKM